MPQLHVFYRLDNGQIWQIIVPGPNDPDDAQLYDLEKYKEHSGVQLFPMSLAKKDVPFLQAELNKITGLPGF